MIKTEGLRERTEHIHTMIKIIVYTYYDDWCSVRQKSVKALELDSLLLSTPGMLTATVLMTSQYLHFHNQIPMTSAVTNYLNQLAPSAAEGSKSERLPCAVSSPCILLYLRMLHQWWNVKQGTAKCTDTSTVCCVRQLWMNHNNKMCNEKSTRRRRKHCALAVVRRNQKN